MAHLTAFSPEGGTIEGGGLATDWRFEWSASRQAVEEEKGALVAGCSGTVSQAEVEASPNKLKVNCETFVTGLTPETTYYVRFVLKNAAGGGSLVEPVTTGPRHPLMGELRGVDESLATSARLSEDIAPNNFETHWRVEYATSRAVVEEGKGTVGPAGVILQAEADEAFHKITAEVSGLSPETVYFARYVAENEFGTAVSAPVSFETAGGPVAEAFAVHAFAGEALRVLGSVKPHGYDTHYHVEYVAQGAWESEGWAAAASTAPVDAGSGQLTNGEFPTQFVGVDLPGLTPGVAYRYRLVASSAAPGSPTVDSAERTLVVPVAGKTEAGGEEGPQPPCANEAVRALAGSRLPDCRAYEQVTPSEKYGAQDVFKYGVRGEGSLVSEDGERFMLHAPGVSWGSSPDSRLQNYFFTRTVSGWQMVSARPEGETGPLSYQPYLFSADLSRVGVEAEWETSEGSLSENVELESGPPGGPYSTIASLPRARLSSEKAWVAMSADHGKLVFQTSDRTLLGSPTGTLSGEDLYEAAGGELRLLNAGIGKCGASIARGFEGYEGNARSQSSPHAISGDGSRVFFEAIPGSDCSSARHLYMRVDGSETTDLGQATFIAADPEGKKLIVEKPSGARHELALYDTSTLSFTALLTTSEPITHPGQGEGQLPVVSADLSALYFFSSERLTSDAPPLDRAIGPEPLNIYRFDVAAGRLEFVAQSGGNTGAFFTGHSTSGDGRFFYWISSRVPDVPGGAGESNQTYRYDNAAHVVQCVSCASPFNGTPKLSATFVEPGATHANGGLPGLRDASENGNYVFFDTPSALVGEDGNGELQVENVGGVHPSSAYSPSSDVYEWRANGVGGCAHVQGCLALISGGAGGYMTVFLGVSASGRDAFFATHEALVRGDTDTAGDVYDARIGGGFAPPAPGPVECQGDACRAPAPPPNDTTPGSLSYSGPGNLVVSPFTPLPLGGSKPLVKRCRRGTVGRHGRCVRARRAHTGSHARRARRGGLHR
ncbi:MAG TPA: hypothetical protein VNY27_10355 [Solirubrobacteraceae bacterium]|nr:hypothetical protein [Solirubrobacteraceae bacterium]